MSGATPSTVSKWRRRVAALPVPVRVEPQGAHPVVGEFDDALVGGVVRDLGDADESGAQLPQRVEQAPLVEPLERTGDDRAAHDPERVHPPPVPPRGEPGQEWRTETDLHS
ncbi:hypothetical protein [Nocardiopsis sp. NPDC006938]|uniref:hypothetical protein n=1 Tax=Nocardiopsis sp. NPDC006938 TaxID=3364337 RepID=UPI0036953E89